MNPVIHAPRRSNKSHALVRQVVRTSILACLALAPALQLVGCSQWAGPSLDAPRAKAPHAMSAALLAPTESRTCR